MNKEEFLRQLEQLLSGISEEERADAIAFYRSYFEDAGEANEASILAELESPQKVAESIRKNLGIEETCTGEKPDGAENYVISQPCADGDSAGDGAGRNGNTGNEYGRNENTGNEYGRNENTGNEYGRNENTGNEYGRNEDAGNGYAGNYASGEEVPKDNSTTVGIIVAVLTAPIWLLLLLIFVSVLLAVVAALFGVAVAVVAVMASLVFTGFVLMGTGIVSLFSGAPAIGVGLLGGGMIVLALGILAVLLVVWIFGAFLPWAFKGIGNLCRKLFNKRKERAAV